MKQKLQPRTEFPDVLTTEQAAAFLGCSTQFLEIARCKGGGPRFSKLGPRLIRYRKAALLEYLASREITSTSAELPKNWQGQPTKTPA